MQPVTNSIVVETQGVFDPADDLRDELYDKIELSVNNRTSTMAYQRAANATDLLRTIPNPVIMACRLRVLPEPYFPHFFPDGIDAILYHRLW